ncbi:MAG: CapA family protein [Oscillatoriales cyanobacterium RM2_1_1]|nr:CapA family protein [Oscillatoriales cyanobacterium SM2_3_0]NJO46116.1 CapA family protein [Oscillatoriales cyanobacterium RM2_1_1]
MNRSRRRKQVVKQVFWIGILLGFALAYGCNQRAPINQSRSDLPGIEVPPPEPQPYSTEATLLAVGDIMMHGSQIKSGYNSQIKTYNYDNFFTEVQPILHRGNWVIGNLETTLAGPEAKYTGYPRFNAPAPLADAIKTAGFNILTTANNHSLDRGEKGVLKTLENLRSRGLKPVGTAASLTEAQNILRVEKNQIDMAILAYTYGTNGIPIPQGKDYLVAVIDEAKIIQDIQTARASGADIVTVALHFGSEYQRQPNTQQKTLVKNLVNAGADIILGSHPHVVQPYEIFEQTNTDGTQRKAVAIYSMGNFISNQREKYRDLGVIFKVRLRKNFPEETIEISEVKGIPTWVHRYTAQGRYQFRILPVEAVIGKRDDALLSSQTYDRLETYLDQMNRHLNSLVIAANSKAQVNPENP